MFVIEEVKDENQKKAVVVEVLKDLPEWFGIPESTQAYIEGTTTLQVWTAYQESDLTGFVSLSYSSEARKKVGYLQVKTVAEGSNKDYDRTNDFYRGLGFKKLEIFPQLWNPQNPCQILIKKLE